MQGGAIVKFNGKSINVGKGIISNPPKCTDSDGGRDYNMKGTLRYTAPGIRDVDDDTCVSENVLAEQYCDGTRQVTESYTCPNGCSNGACNINCKPGQAIGDVDGDGRITVYDANLSLQITPLGASDQPANICCIDTNQDGIFSPTDVNKILNIARRTSTSPGYCPVTCKEGQKIGDVNADGIIDAQDRSAVQKIVVGLIKEPINNCCMDINKNGNVNSFDATMVARIAANLDAKP